MATLTEQQAEFVHHLVTTGCNPTEAARAAGYAVPKQEAYRLTRLPHVQAAIRQERERLISAHGANVALATLNEIMRDKTAPASARVSASRTMLEAAGLFDKNGRDTGTGKTLQEMTTDELAETISKLDREMVRIAGSTSVN
ncbi:terminase small subunit [Novosphingobium sp.]|uniref:terminase small subunit n=1 Tax=Novosphingobium sp. TaxID=1874826 RepID=UPI0035AD79AE